MATTSPFTAPNPSATSDSFSSVVQRTKDLEAINSKEKTLRKRLETINTNKEIIIASTFEKALEDDKGYGYYKREMTVAELRHAREMEALDASKARVVTKVEAEIDNLKKTIQLWNERKELEIQQIRNQMDAYNERKQMELLALTKEINRREEEFALKKNQSTTKQEGLLEYYKKNIEDKEKQLRSPNTPAFKKLQAEEQLIKHQLGELEKEAQQIISRATGAIAVISNQIDKAAKEREAEEEKMRRRVLEEGQAQWEARMAAENAAQLMRQKEREAAKNEIVTLSNPPSVFTDFQKNPKNPWGGWENREYTKEELEAIDTDQLDEADTDILFSKLNDLKNKEKYPWKYRQMTQAQLLPYRDFVPESEVQGYIEAWDAAGLREAIAKGFVPLE